MCLERSKRQAKAIGMTYHPRYERSLLVVWDDEHLDFHWSREKNLLAGFQTEFSTRRHFDLGHGFRPGGLLPGTYQSVNLVTDVDGTVYLIGTRNESKASPTVPAPNWMDLYRLSWGAAPDDTAAGGTPATPPTDPPRVEFVRGREIQCKNQQCNFGAAAGVYVDHEKHMFLYAAAHWLHDGNKRFNFNEYSPE